MYTRKSQRNSQRNRVGSSSSHSQEHNEIHNEISVAAADPDRTIPDDIVECADLMNQMFMEYQQVSQQNDTMNDSSADLFEDEPDEEVALLKEKTEMAERMKAIVSRKNELIKKHEVKRSEEKEKEKRDSETVKKLKSNVSKIRTNTNELKEKKEEILLYCIFHEPLLSNFKN